MSTILLSVLLALSGCGGGDAEPEAPGGIASFRLIPEGLRDVVELGDAQLREEQVRSLGYLE